MMKSKNIQHPACRAEALKERKLETRIQDQSILAMVFIATAKFEYRILCNCRVNLQNLFQPAMKLKQNFRPRLARGRFVDLGMTEQDAIVFDSVLTHQQILDGHGAGLGKLLQLLRRQLDNG